MAEPVAWLGARKHLYGLATAWPEIQAMEERDNQLRQSAAALERTAQRLRGDADQIAARRKLLIDWTKRHWGHMRTEQLALACVAPGAFQRSIITGLLWFIQPSCPIEVHERRDTAIRWAIGVLESNGLKVPSLGAPSAVNG